MFWHKVEKRLPKKIDYYLISDGSFYSVGVYVVWQKKFVDRNIANPIENIKYWKKISVVPGEKLNLPNAMIS